MFAQRFDAIATTMVGVEFELLLVDDGSRDGTLALARAVAAEDDRIRVLSFSRNFGKEAAILAGLTHATGDFVAVMDADLQDPPELLVKMFAVLRDTGCDCVAARRVTRTGESAVRSVFARAFYRMINLVSQVRVEDGVRDFRLMRREMVDAILLLGERRRFSKGLFAWVGFKVEYVTYQNVERAAGSTKWSFWGLLRYALEGVFSLTDAPLSLPLPLGLCSALACLILLLAHFRLAAMICGVACLIFFSLYLLGLYTARVYWEAKNRPLYIKRRDP